MAHDRNGNLLKPGDKVLIPATVTDVFLGEEHCNVNLDLLPMPPYAEPHRLSNVNTRQVVLFESAATDTPAETSEA